MILILVTDQLTNLFKVQVGRLRPCFDSQLKDMIRLVKSTCGGKFSFFSGHASNSFALAFFFGKVVKRHFKMVNVILIFIAGLICTSISTSLSGSPTKADEEQGWYLTLGGGLAAIQDTEWKWGTYSGELQHSSGFSGEIGLGKDFGRSRLEITYARNTGDLDAITVDQAGTAVSVSGGVTQDGIFVTGLYELTDDEDAKITPYIGGGIGYNRTKWDNVTVAGTN